MKTILTIFAALLMSFAVQAKEITLTADNTLVLNQSFSNESVTKLMEEATKLDANLKSGYPMYLFLYTPGGSIQAGLELYEFFDGLNRPVHTVTLFAASMGWQTVQHLGTRYIMRYGVLMAHKARGSFRGEFGGTLSQLDSRYGMWLRRIDMMDKITVKRTNGKQSLKTYRASYDNELWLNGYEAVKAGYADEVVTVKCDKSLGGTTSKTANMGFFSIKADFSQCPLKTAPVGISASLITNEGTMTLDKFLESNGSFGKCVKEIEEDLSYNSYSYNSTPKFTTKEGLCAKDPKLTLEKIKKAMEDHKKHINRDLKDNVEYSY